MIRPRPYASGSPVRTCELRQRRMSGGIRVEDALVVRLPVLGERLHHVRVGLVAVGLEGAEHHPETAVRHDGALERGLGLEPDDDLVVLVDVARARAP